MTVPTKPAESRIGWVLRKGLMVCAAVFGISLMAMFILAMLWGGVSGWVAVWLLISAGLAVLFGVGHFFYVLFAKVQARLGEWVITFFVGAASAGGLMTVFKEAYGTETGDEFMTGATVLVAVASTIIGSAWGWSICQQLNEQNGMRRLFILAQGWLLVIGAGAFALFAVIGILILCALVIGLALPDQELYSGWGICLLFSLLGIPGMLLSRKVRRLALERPSVLSAAPAEPSVMDV